MKIRGVVSLTMFPSFTVMVYAGPERTLRQLADALGTDPEGVVRMLSERSRAR